MSEELKPCPSGCKTHFKDKELPFIKVCETEDDHYFVECSCGWRTSEYLTKESAVRAWNARANPTADKLRSV